MGIPRGTFYTRSCGHFIRCILFHVILSRLELLLVTACSTVPGSRRFFCVYYVDLFFFLSVCLSRFYGLYLAYYMCWIFDHIWWKCWNFGPIDCIKISLRYAARALRYAWSEWVKRVKKNFCISMRFRGFRVDWHTPFFSKMFMSAKRKMHASKARKMWARIYCPSPDYDARIVFTLV